MLIKIESEDDVVHTAAMETFKYISTNAQTDETVYSLQATNNSIQSIDAAEKMLNITTSLNESVKNIKLQMSKFKL